MAEPLSAEAVHRGAGDNVLSGMTREEYFDFLRRYDNADMAVDEALADRKNLRAEIKQRGVPLAAFDRARRDSEKSGEKRELEELAYRQMMQWRMKPVGWQASFDLQSDDPEYALNEQELAWIEKQGFEAGHGGHRRDSNSYTPGTAGYAQWDEGWRRGDATRGGLANGEDPAPKRRGRPRGSKNRPKDDVEVAIPDEAAVRAARADGIADAEAGHREHADRWPPGALGHADYELGHQEVANRPTTGESAVSVH